MIRCAFTIVLNGLHHLQHNNYAHRVLSMVDHWIVVEGASDNKGSTYWCNRPLPNYHRAGRSIDGTYEYLSELAKKDEKLHVISKAEPYSSKDEQVGKAIEKLQNIAKDEQVMLWQIDVDEQWSKDCMIEAEKQLGESKCNAARFFWNFYVGPRLIVRGTWGEYSGGKGVCRLWKWKANRVRTHEPPEFVGLDNKIWLPQRCNHFAYYYEKDVVFKSLWYKGYQKMHGNWLRVQSYPGDRIPIEVFVDGIQAVRYETLKDSYIERIAQDELTVDCG